MPPSSAIFLLNKQCLTSKIDLLIANITPPCKPTLFSKLVSRILISELIA